MTAVACEGGMRHSPQTGCKLTLAPIVPPDDSHDLHLQSLQALQGGFEGLKNINLEIRRGEIPLLWLGPNGAGKTTLISIVCGIVNPSEGQVTVDGHDIVRDYRAARTLIGLVPQELTTDAFETVHLGGLLQPRPVRQARQPAILKRCCARCRCGKSERTGS